MTDEDYMRIALAEAKTAAAQDEAPLGAVITSIDGDIAAKRGDASISHGDPTANAVILALRDAVETTQNYRLVGCTLYTTQKPCALSAGAIAKFRLLRVVWGAPNINSGAVDVDNAVKGGIRTLEQTICQNLPNVVGGVLADESASMLDAFSKRRQRQLKSTVFLSPTTSGTGSMARILRIVMGCHLIARWARQPSANITLKYPSAILGESAPPEQEHLFLVNTPQSLPSSWISPKYRYIINFRDPRDHACNTYHWQFSHPVRDIDEEQRTSYTGEVRRMGIDGWVILKSSYQLREHNDAYDRLFQILEEHPEQCLVLTYARLCLDFDDFIRRLSHFTGIPVTKSMLNRLEIERPENLGDNPKWVGNRWEGSDVMPGRYKRELQPETIEFINKRLEPRLRQMAKYDPDYAHLYLGGL